MLNIQPHNRQRASHDMSPSPSPELHKGSNDDPSAEQPQTLSSLENNGREDEQGETQTLVPNVPVQNRFSSLTTDPEDEDETNDNDTDRQGPTPPPIILKDITDFIELAKKIEAVCKGTISFRSKNDSTSLKTSCAADYRAATNILKEMKVQYHTHILRKDAKAKLVIRGLNKSIATSYIQESLKDLGFSVDTVSQLRSQWKREDETDPTSPKRLLPLFAVYTQASDITALMNINTLCYCKVTVEKFRPQTGPTQCYRCQRFGHTANYCTINPRCMKCGMDHPTIRCTKLRNVVPCCLNCSGEHTSNYRGCPYYKAARDRMRNVPRPTNATRRPAQPVFVPSAPPTTNPWHRKKTLEMPNVTSPDTFPPLMVPSQVYRAARTQIQAPDTTPPFLAPQPVQQPHSHQPPRAGTPPPIPNNPSSFDFQAFNQWATNLLNAIFSAPPEQKLQVVMSHTMPMYLAQSMYTQYGSTP